MEFTLEQILHSIRPKSSWLIRNSISLEWRDKVQTEPTEEEIEEGRKKLEAQWKADEYKRLRKLEYPSIEECVHAILDDTLEELQAKRKAVKDKYPK